MENTGQTGGTHTPTPSHPTTQQPESVRFPDRKRLGGSGLSLGTCGRAYGTNCHHEHACVRCALLRPDPGQISRLQDIIANLRDRIEEAEKANWLGEAEGLKISLAGAEDKLGQMDRQLSATVDLGLPTTRPRR